MSNAKNLEVRRTFRGSQGLQGLGGTSDFLGAVALAFASVQGVQLGLGRSPSGPQALLFIPA